MFREIKNSNGLCQRRKSTGKLSRNIQKICNIKKSWDWHQEIKCLLNFKTLYEEIHLVWFFFNLNINYMWIQNEVVRIQIVYTITDVLISNEQPRRIYHKVKYNNITNGVIFPHYIFHSKIKFILLAADLKCILYIELCY